MTRDRASVASYVQPLPKGIRQHIDRQPRPRDGDNLGLWLDKYLPLDPEKLDLKAEERVRLLGDLFVARKLGRPVPWRSPATAEAIARMRQSCGLLYGEGGYRELRASVRGRLLIDYARLSTIESSLSFHATLGVPRIPGSALKGLLRAALRHQVSAALLEELFGAPDLEEQGARGEHRRGRLVLHDALPDGAFQLDLDVLTPHFGDYYSDSTGRTPPADWLSPSPTTFLTVVATTFVVFAGILPAFEGGDAPRTPAATLLDEVQAALGEALWEEGLGAKRAAGYGRLVIEEAG